MRFSKDNAESGHKRKGSIFSTKHDFICRRRVKNAGKFEMIV
jgi:hypothetical protein